MRNFNAYLAQWSTLAKPSCSRTSFSRVLQPPNRHPPHHLHILLNLSGRKQQSAKSTDMSQSSPSAPRPIWMKYKERSIRRNEANRRALEHQGESADRPPKKQKRPGSESMSRRKDKKSCIDLNLNNECLRIIQETLDNAESHRSIQMDVSTPVQGKHSTETERFRRWRDRRLNPLEAAEKSIELQTQLRTLRSTHKIDLPMNQFAPQVVKIVAENHFCTIVGETGSGKTTQVPQILFNQVIDDGTGSSVNILCTQPRRIAATSVARRVAAERGQNTGQTVGYHIRHDAILPNYGGSITYCTTGILLKQLQNPDEVMDSVSHIILDEVHERDINLDFTLIMIKRSFIERARLGKSIPKLILMSATVDTSIFENYFADQRLGPLAGPCPVLRVPGRTFPVQRHYLTDITNTLSKDGHLELCRDPWVKSELSFNPEKVEKSPGFPPITLFSTLIAHVIKTTSSGAVLVFMPGLAEIQKVSRTLVAEKPLGFDFGDETKFQVYQLHSLIEKDQRTVFEESEPGVRKIILSTNIAETSVTIPDVTVVIDSGRIRRMEYDSTRRISELRTVYVSQSNLNQRAGRAGRVQAGDYYGLFHEDRLSTLAPLPVPEMRLSDLADLGLTVRAQQNPVPIAEFLADAIEPPPRQAVDAAVSDLTNLGAITHDEVITNLGQTLARLPLHPALGKMVILGILFKCVDPIIILGLAAESAVWDLGTLQANRAANQMRLHFTEPTLSEHLALLHAYHDLRTAVDQNPNLDTYAWCRRHFLRPLAMRHIDLGASQVEEILAESGLIPPVPDYRKQKKVFSGIFGPPHLNTSSNNESLIRGALAAGLQPNMAWASFVKPGQWRSFDTPHAAKLEYSMNWENMLPMRSKALRNILPLMLFDKSVWTDKSRTTCFSTMTPVSPLIAALFGDQPREPSAEDKAWMSREKNKSQEPGNLVLGRANPAESENKTRRLIMMVSSATTQEAAENVVVDNGARDALLRFRNGMDRTLERVLRDLAQGRAVDEDPEWTIFVDGLVRLVGADDWDGLEKGTRIIGRLKSKRSRKSHGRSPVGYGRRISIGSDEPKASSDGSDEDWDGVVEGDSDGDSDHLEDDKGPS